MPLTAHPTDLEIADVTTYLRHSINQVTATKRGWIVQFRVERAPGGFGDQAYKIHTAQYSKIPTVQFEDTVTKSRPVQFNYDKLTGRATTTPYRIHF